jgi:hypothetical protein
LQAGAAAKRARAANAAVRIALDILIFGLLSTF